MEDSSQFHAPVILLPEKGPPKPIGQEGRWALEPVWTLWRREKKTLSPACKLIITLKGYCKYN
jgi:hypothetical protein